MPETTWTISVQTALAVGAVIAQMAISHWRIKTLENEQKLFKRRLNLAGRILGRLKRRMAAFDQWRADHDGESQ